MPCAGNAGQTCGGPGANSVYAAKSSITICSFSSFTVNYHITDTFKNNKIKWVVWVDF